MNNQKIKMYNPEIHHRHSIRLKEYDYSSEGLYFITVCAQDKKCMFGKIINGDMYLNEAGRLVEKWYLKLQEKYPDIICMEHIIMPNHFHCIIRIVGAGFARPNASTGTYAHIDNDEMPYAENRAGKPRPFVATQLLRTHHPQPAFIRRNIGLYHHQPITMGERPIIH